MTVDTPFHIASIDKIYTASVIMMLFESGHIELDEPIRTYLPQKLIGGIHRFDGVDYTDVITVRHLLSHTSGLADCLEDRPKGGRSLMERLFHDGDMAWSVEDLMRIVRDELSPHFAPQPAELKRQKARYCDTNYQLLIAIIEAVTGQPIHRVFEERLFNPLQLKHTHFFGYSLPREPTPEVATIWFYDKPLIVPKALRSFPSIYGNAEECLVFLRALIQGELFCEPETLAEMQRHWNRFGFPFDSVALRSPAWPIEYGLGLMRFRLPRILTPLHPMPAVVGHTGSTGSWLFYCQEFDVLICGTVDQATAGAVPYRAVPKILRALCPVKR